MSSKDNDIRKTGSQTYRELQKANAEAYQQALQNTPNNYKNMFYTRPTSPLEFIKDEDVASPLLQSGQTAWGESIYDNNQANLYEWERLGDIRANNQPWYSKLASGLGKGVTTAATTFLDGTVGLLYGIGAAINEGRIGAIFDNDVSNSLREFNEEMERILPNYRTTEEQENAWYQNLGTMNFWADSFLKNLGFTVGAYYSGAAWLKGLKAAGMIKNSLSASATGSLLSGFNEARIEANNTKHDLLNLRETQIMDAGRQRYQEIMNSNLSDNEKQIALNDLNNSIEALRQDANQKADAAGLTTLIGNTILLTLNDFAMYGKLYARSMKGSGKLGNNLTQTAEDMANEEAGKNIAREGGKYIWQDITKGEAVAKGLKNGLIEGNEELAQAFISEYAGNRQSYDSPDAYYQALTDKNAQLKTKDFLSSVTEAFTNTYGNGDRWEEFAVGALTGLFGMPTFGRANNSDANTYLGRGKAVGLSGGLFGEIGYANWQNQQGREAVDVMNKYMDKMQSQARYHVQSTAFTDAMNGWSETDNTFEYKNAKDNDDYAAVSKFAQVGKLGELKEMVRKDFENISDEELEQIAAYNSPNVNIGPDGTIDTKDSNGNTQTGGWRNVDGSLMSSTEEGRAKMREELTKKRDKILSQIDKYEKSVEAVRAASNNSLTEDQVNELAWLNWKVGMFSDRYNAIKEDNHEFLTETTKGIQAFLNGRGRGMVDEEAEEGKNIIKAMETTKQFINILQDSKSPLQMATFIKNNPQIMKFIDEVGYPILEGIVGFDAETFDKSMKDLKDTIKIAEASEQFNNRYKDFIKNPVNLVKNREKIDKKKEKVNKATENVSKKDKINNSEVSDIVKDIDNGNVTTEDLSGLFTDEDTEFLNNGGVEEQAKAQSTGKQKVEEAQKIIKTTQQVNRELDKLNDGNSNPQAINDAKKLLQNSKDVANSEQELLDLNTQAFNDPSILFDDESMQNMTGEQIQSALQDRIDEAKSILEIAKTSVQTQQEELANLPKNGEVLFTPEQAIESEPESTGHDGTTVIKTENEVQKEKAEEEAKRLAEAKKTGDIESLFDGVKATIEPRALPQFDKSLGEVLDNINRLVKAGANDAGINNSIKNTMSYKILKGLAPSIDGALDVYITVKRNPKETKTVSKQKVETIKTPVVTEEEVRNSTTTQLNSNPNQQEQSTLYQYWKPTISYLPFGKAYAKGSTTPFYKLARGVNSALGFDYSEAQLRRIEAVGEYLEAHDTFKLVDSGEVKAGDEVHFVIDSSLNDKAGETVILMADKQGRIIGDVMSPLDKTFNQQIGLKAFVDRVTQEYKDAGSPEHFTSKETTTIAKNMVGKVPYLADNQTFNTLNDIFKEIPFFLGIAATDGPNARILASPGRTFKQGESDFELSIKPPLTAKAGQPFLLMPTSSSIDKYMPVPFTMPLFGPANQNSTLGQAIYKVLSEIPNQNNGSIISTINALEELLSFEEIHINYTGDDVKVTIKNNGAEHQRTIYNGSKNAPDIAQQIADALQGIPFQISRKYVNTTYEGKDYNKMIGELAGTNLPIGATHTVSDWFTLNPIDANGKPLKAKSPKSEGFTIGTKAPTSINVTIGSNNLSVDTKTWEVKKNGSIYRGTGVQEAKARAYGIFTKQNMDKPYNTSFGWFNPVTNNFIEEPKQEQTITIKDSPSENLEDRAKKEGLLGNKVRQALWKVLTPEQQATIVNKKGPKQKQWMTALEGAFDVATNSFNETKLKGSVDIFLGRKGLNRNISGSSRVWNKDKELSWLAKTLPQFSNEERLRIVDGLIKVNNSNNPEYAYGQFRSGVINISDLAAHGTVYHEAFHAVTHTLLSEKEYKDLFNAAKEKWGDKDTITLEENLAEDFRKYIQLEETPFVGSVVKIYRILKHLIQNLIGNEIYINKLFYDISKGNISSRKPNDTNVIRNRAIEELEDLRDIIARKKSELNSITKQWNKVSRITPDRWFNITVGNKTIKYKQYSNTSYITKDTAEEKIPSDLKDVLIVREDRGAYYILVDRKENVDKKDREKREEIEKELKSLMAKLPALKTEAEKERKALMEKQASEELLLKDEVYYNIATEQHYRDKLMYDNLSQDEKDYIKDRGISIEEYNDMSQYEKEVLFHCKY